MRNFVCIRLIGMVFFFTFSASLSVLAALPSKQEVLDIMLLVEDHWIYGYTNPGDNQWARATHFEGTMALYWIYADEMYYDYALNWAELHDFELNGGDTTRNADNQCAGQTYLDLNDIDPAPRKIEHIKASIDNMVNNPKDADDWWWIDALQMAMPVFARLGDRFSKTDYFDTMWALYHHTKYEEEYDGLYSDNGKHNYGDYLWWRDDNFDPPKKSPNEAMIYWSRGNGWVIAALVRTLEYLDITDSHREEYIKTFQDMASSLITRQRSDGFWNMNLDDPNDCGGMETSGTAFFTYAIAWGIRQGILDEETYISSVEAAWNGMVNHAIHSDGKLGYVQDVGDKPSSDPPVTFESTSDFGVGAFLLAGSEVFKMASGTTPVPETRTVYQAENATIYNGQVDSNWPRYTGSGFVNYYNEVGSYVTYTVNVSGDGERNLLMRFANGSSDNRYMDINVNGGGIEYDNVAFNPTGSWSSWGYQRVTVDLVDGNNTIQIIADQSSGGPNLDKIEIGSVSTAVNFVWYSASDFSEVHTLFGNNTGTVTMEFDVTPLDSNIDGVIGYADTSTDITSWNSMAILVRMFTNGRFEARDGDTYTADTNIYYSANTEYHVRIEADMSAETYDVWITPNGGTETQIADDYDFRSDAPITNDIGKVGLIGDTSENFQIENHIVNDLICQ